MDEVSYRELEKVFAEVVDTVLERLFDSAFDHLLDKQEDGDRVLKMR